MSQLQPVQIPRSRLFNLGFGTSKNNNYGDLGGPVLYCCAEALCVFLQLEQNGGARWKTPR